MGPRAHINVTTITLLKHTCAVWTVLDYRLGQCKIHEVLLVQGQPSCRTHSLVPRPFEEGDEKGPGTHGQRMRQYLPESIRILCHCINKPCGARIITKIVQEYLAVSVMYDGLRTEIREYAEGIQGKYDHPNFW